jgi:hypothetical protein
MEQVRGGMGPTDRCPAAGIDLRVHRLAEIESACASHGMSSFQALS